MKYRCFVCEYRFETEDEVPYCPSCNNEALQETDDDNYVTVNSIINIKKESHHIHPKFMDNPNGLGQQYLVVKKTHNLLHGMIMNWIWEEIPEENKKTVIKNIIENSKRFIGVDDDT